MRMLESLIAIFLTRSLGPFKSEEDFNTTLAKTYIAKSKGQVGPYIRDMLNTHKHSIIFTHGDLKPRNIIVKDGRVMAIVDWRYQGGIQIIGSSSRHSTSSRSLMTAHHIYSAFLHLIIASS